MTPGMNKLDQFPAFLYNSKLFVFSSQTTTINQLGSKAHKNNYKKKNTNFLAVGQLFQFLELKITLDSM